jgi:hypothetical protein
VNVLFFFILNRPAQTESARLQQSIQELQSQILLNQGSLKNMERTSSQLERFDDNKNSLLKMHLLQRQTGYSEVVTSIDKMAQDSGVKKTRVLFNLDPKARAGLTAVTITLPLEGGYTNVVEFIRALEQSDTLFLITNIELSTSETVASPTGVQPLTASASSSSSGGGAVALSLGLETYFYQ